MNDEPDAVLEEWGMGDWEFEDENPAAPVAQPQPQQRSSRAPPRAEPGRNDDVRPVFVPRQEAFGGGEMYRPIYCGMDPANKPKNAIFGTRWACYKKGVYNGKKISRHG